MLFWCLKIKKVDGMFMCETRTVVDFLNREMVV